MFETNSKLPKIFVYMMSVLATCMFIGLFFGIGYVRIPYFLAILVCVVMFILDKKQMSLTNYKLTYLLFAVVNLLAVSTIIVYEYSKHTKHLNLFLILLVVVQVLTALIDVFILKNKNLTKKINQLIDFLKICSMVCIITYFFGVSDLYFAIVAVVFEIANIVVKISTKFRKIETDLAVDAEATLEDIIKSADREKVGE